MGSDATTKALDVLEALADLGSASLPQIQTHARLSLTTSHRIMQTLIARGFAVRSRKGEYRLGARLVTLMSGVSLHDLLSSVARPHLARLSRATSAHAHLGVLENGMVTYLVKQRFGRTRIHSAEGAQLEAYCSAIGKVLLASLPLTELDAYIAEGEFVALTPNTITDPADLRTEIDLVRGRNWAEDREEIAPGLNCASVPIRDHDGSCIAALSVSRVNPAGMEPQGEALLTTLECTARAISLDLFPFASSEPPSRSL